MSATTVYDPFDGTSLLPEWITYTNAGGTITVSGGKVTFTIPPNDFAWTAIRRPMGQLLIGDIIELEVGTGSDRVLFGSLFNEPSFWFGISRDSNNASLPRALTFYGDGTAFITSLQSNTTSAGRVDAPNGPLTNISTITRFGIRRSNTTEIQFLGWTGSEWSVIYTSDIGPATVGWENGDFNNVWLNIGLGDNNDPAEVNTNRTVSVLSIGTPQGPTITNVTPTNIRSSGTLVNISVNDSTGINTITFGGVTGSNLTILNSTTVQSTTSGAITGQLVVSNTSGTTIGPTLTVIPEANVIRFLNDVVPWSPDPGPIVGTPYNIIVEAWNSVGLQRDILISGSVSSSIIYVAGDQVNIISGSTSSLWVSGTATFNNVVFGESPLPVNGTTFTFTVQTPNGLNTTVGTYNITSPTTSSVAKYIPFFVERMTSGSGTTLITTSIPCKSAEVMPNDNLRVIINNVEIDAYIERVGAPRRDGSTRLLLVQFNYPLTEGVPVQCFIKSSPNLTPNTPSIVYQAQTFTSMSVSDWKTSSPIPAIGYSTDIVRNCVSGIAEWIVPPAAFDNTLPLFQVNEDRFAYFGDQEYDAYTGDTVGNNFADFDPVYILLVRFLRSGDVSLYKKALRLYGRLRTLYWQPNNWNVPASHNSVEGMTLGALLFSDAGAQTAIINRATSIANTTGSHWTDLSTTTGNADASIVANNINLYLAAYDLGVTNSVNGRTFLQWATDYSTQFIAAPGWTTTGENAGRYEWTQGSDTYSNNPLVVLACIALARVWDRARNASILNRISLAMTWMYTTQRREPPPLVGSVAYPLANKLVSGYSDGVTPDTNTVGLYICIFSWMAGRIGSLWSDRALEIFYTITRSPLDGIWAPQLYNSNSPTTLSGRTYNVNYLYMGRALGNRF